jgi:hypothetical protein
MPLVDGSMNITFCYKGVRTMIRLNIIEIVVIRAKEEWSPRGSINHLKVKIIINKVTRIIFVELTNQKKILP